MTRTVAVDFDGVVHDYPDGWQDGSIYGDLVPNALTALVLLMNAYPVFIHTSRDPEQVVAWMTTKWNDDIDRPITITADDRCPRCGGASATATASVANTFLAPMSLQHQHTACRSCEGTGLLKFWNQRDALLVTNRKLPATAYIDDRGIRFHDWDQALTDLERLEEP